MSETVPDIRRSVALTVDTEAHAARSDHSDPLEHLVWGRFNGQQLGISEMMEVADKHNIRMTFYVDYPEFDIYGDSFLDVAREIHARGHNAELHIHPEVLASDFASSRGLATTSKFSLMGLNETSAVVEYVHDLHQEAVGAPATSFRGGGYRYTENVLLALKSADIQTVSNDNASHAVGLLPPEPRGPFKWENDLVELPVTSATNFRNLETPLQWNFNKGTFSKERFTPEQAVERHMEFLEGAEVQTPDIIPVLVMHSWSFWDLDEHQKRAIPRPDAIERFDLLLSELTAKYDVKGIDEIGADFNVERRAELRSQAFQI